MSLKNGNTFDRRRSSSLKERFLNNNRERKKTQSVRARLQSAGALKAGSENDLTIAPLNTKYNLLKETSLRVYKLEVVAPRNPWGRLKNNSRFPWSWDAHNVIIGDKELFSTTPVGVFAEPIPYISIETWMAVSVPHLPFSYIKLATKDISFLIQAPDMYQRDRLLHSIQWKRNVCKYEKILYSASRPEVILQELQNLVKLMLEGPIYIDDTHHALLDIVSHLLIQNRDIMNSLSNESLITTLGPLFEGNQPSIEICKFFTKHCHDCPRSRVVIEMFTPVVQRILKHNTNFGKTMWLRTFVKEYIQALNSQNDGEVAVRAFVRSIHGPLSICPHIRILNNLVAVCLSAIYDSFAPHTKGKLEERMSGPYCSFSERSGKRTTAHGDKNLSLGAMKGRLSNTRNELWELSLSKYSKNLALTQNNNILDATNPGLENTKSDSGSFKQCNTAMNENDLQKTVDVDPTEDIETALLFVKILDEISTLSDWLHGLAILLQPIPFQDEAMQNEVFTSYMVKIMERIVADSREQIIWCLLSLREQKNGWLQVFSPHNNVYHDDGVLFTKMVAVLLDSAKKSGKTKKLVKILLNSCLSAVVLLALRESDVMIEVLCYVLEYRLVVGQKELQVVSTLRSTKLGTARYDQLCEQETVMRQKGGPDEYTLPPRSTDRDLHKFLSSGSNGNLKNLNLSFTHISCKSADVISRLPALQHLNLWSSNIRDAGLRRLCESLNLKTLNLCETRVTDESIKCLKEMTNLTELNLNSTPVSEIVYQELRNSLPNLVHCDIAYTEAWPGSPVHYGGKNNTNEPCKENVKARKLEYTQNI